MHHHQLLVCFAYWLDYHILTVKIGITRNSFKMPLFWQDSNNKSARLQCLWHNKRAN